MRVVRAQLEAGVEEDVVLLLQQLRLARYGEIWRGMARYGETWRDMARHGETWRDMARYGEI